MDRYRRSSPHNMIHICVDQHDGTYISGKAFNTTLKEPIVFLDINELILKMDLVFDKNGNPLPSKTMRSFKKAQRSASYTHKPEQYSSYDEYLQVQGQYKTFDIVVKSRRMSSWQGILFYKDQEITFDNVLDLLKKIQNNVFCD